MGNVAGSTKKSTSTKKRKKRTSSAPKASNADIFVKLFELLQGEREKIYIYSKKLGCKICLVNPALINPKTIKSNYPVYTTKELAFILSFDADELRRFHYLKTRLVE